MSADAGAACNASFGERSPDRTNKRNGYRERTWDTRVGTVELAIPKLRSGSYFASWLLEARRRAERALVAVVAECYVLGVSTRRVEGLVQLWGSSRYPRARSRRWPGASTRWWRAFAPARSTRVPTATRGSTPWSTRPASPGRARSRGGSRGWLR